VPRLAVAADGDGKHHATGTATMDVRRRNLVFGLAAAGFILLSAAGALYWLFGGPVDEVRDEAAHAAVTAGEKLAPVVNWKVRLLRAIRIL
jgi:hypothetical protein